MFKLFLDLFEGAIVTLNSLPANIVLEFKFFPARLYLRKKRIYLELFVLILSKRGRTCNLQLVPLLFLTM